MTLICQLGSALVKRWSHSSNAAKFKKKVARIFGTPSSLRQHLPQIFQGTCNIGTETYLRSIFVGNPCGTNWSQMRPVTSTAKNEHKNLNMWACYYTCATHPTCVHCAKPPRDLGALKVRATKNKQRVGYSGFPLPHRMHQANRLFRYPHPCSNGQAARALLGAVGLTVEVGCEVV